MHSIEVFSTLQVEGTHSWPECPFDEVGYLRDEHRHVFHVKAYKAVTHTDRDVEFIIFKHQLLDWFRSRYWDDNKKCCVFGRMSCEDIASVLAKEFDLTAIEVSEDGENGCRLVFPKES